MIETGFYQKAAVQTRDWGPPPEGAPRNVVATVLYKRPPTHTPQSPHHHSLSDPRPLTAVLQASSHRTLSGLWFRGDDTNAPTVIFMCVLGGGSYPLARSFLRARIIEEIIRSQQPTNSSAPSPPVGPPEQLLPRSFSTTLSLLCSSYCWKFQSYSVTP